MALGKTKLVFFRELVYFIIRTPTFIWAVLVYWLTGAIYASAITSLIYVGFNLYLYAQLSGDSFFRPIIQIRRSLAGCMAMAMYFLIIRPAAPAIETLPVPAQLLTDVFIGAGLHFATVFSLWALEKKPDGFEAFIAKTAQMAFVKLAR